MINFNLSKLTRGNEFNGFQTFNECVNTMLTEAIEENLIEILKGETTTKEVLIKAIDENRKEVLIELANDYVVDADVEEEYKQYAVGEGFEAFDELIESIVDEFKGKNIYETESLFAEEKLIIVSSEDDYYLARIED